MQSRDTETYAIADALESEHLVPSCARIAAYDTLLSAPRIVEIPPMPVQDFIGTLSSRTYELSRSLGGTIPYTVIQELVENFIHAGFKEPVISIYDRGNTITFSDQGPGITDKKKAQLPGFTSATHEMKQYIRGVGSGLPIVKEFLDVSGGSLHIDDNLSAGTTITISLVQHETNANPVKTPETTPREVSTQDEQHEIRLSQREQQILELFQDYDELGQTDVKRLLDISIGSCSRAFDSLERQGLVVSNSSRKRVLTKKGTNYVLGNNYAEGMGTTPSHSD